MVGHMGAVLLPSSLPIPKSSSIPVGQKLDPLWDYLYQSHNIEVVVFQWENHRILRFSIQAYVDQSDLERLYSVLTTLDASDA